MPWGSIFHLRFYGTFGYFGKTAVSLQFTYCRLKPPPTCGYDASEGRESEVSEVTDGLDFSTDRVGWQKAAAAIETFLSH